MAITYIGGHATNNFTPAFNQVNYYFDSNKKNEAGFRYVVDLYISGTATKIFEGRLAPRSGDGYGFVPLQAHLANRVSFEESLDISLNATNSYFKFDIKIGEEYIVIFNYTDYEFFSSAGFYNGYTKLVQTPNVTPHTYQVGDTIEIRQTDGGALKPNLEGLFVVVEVPDAYTVVIDIPFSYIGSGATMGGKIKYADNRKTIFRDLNVQTATVYNGALKFKDFPTTPSSVYKIITASATNKLLTSFPELGMRATLTQDIFINIGNFYSMTAAYIYFENDNGEIFRKGIGASSSSAIRRISVGASNLGALLTVSGVAPLVKAETKYYTYWITDITGAQMSRRYRLDIDRRCAINTTELLFMDRMGSMLSFAFQANITEKFDVKREGFNKTLGALKSGEWTYATTDAGRTTTSVSVDKDYMLRSYWITEAQSILFEELITSPLILMKLEGVYYRVEITDTGGTVDSQKTKEMIKKQVSVRMANQENINA